MVANKIALSEGAGKLALSPSQIQNLTTWLQSLPQGTIPFAFQKSEYAPTLYADQFEYGQSNPTFKVTATIPSQEFVFVLRKQPDGKLLPGAHRLDREYRVLSALQNTAVPVPETYAYCRDCTILGVEFYTMQYVSGHIFKDISFPDLHDPTDVKQIFLESIRVLLDLRQVDLRALGLQSLSRTHPPWIDRHVDTWYRQYRKGLLPGVDYSSIETLYARLVEQQKRKFSASGDGQCLLSDEYHLVHGDFRIDNLIFQRCGTDLKCVAILDWELVSIGNPLADLASLLVPFYMPSNSSNLTILRSLTIPHPPPPGFPSEHEIISRYNRGINKKSDINESLRLYLSVALFKLAAILCGVQARAFQGNAASIFANELGQQAHLFARAAHKVLDYHGPVSESTQHTLPVQKISNNLLKEVCQFMKKEVMPLEDDFLHHISSALRWTPWRPLKHLMHKAKALGLWNLFMPKSLGGSLSNIEYAPLASAMGRCLYGAAVFNCSAPDTGNMELLARFGTTEQKERWLKPLLNGEIRSCFGMTEPDVASSDATNLRTQIVKDKDNYIINGRKWWTSGALDKNCKVMLLIGRGPIYSSATVPKHRQHTVLIIPMSTQGVKIVRHLTVFGFDDAPHGHAEIELNNVIVNERDALLHVEGGGFEAAQSRLGGGRLHHCMRLVGTASRAQDLLVHRAGTRHAFGKPLIENDNVIQQIGENRCRIESMRAIVNEAAAAVDSGNHDSAKLLVGAAKIHVPRAACDVIDRAIQIHGGLGVCQDSLLNWFYAYARTLRIADGPDEVHIQNIAKKDIQNWRRMSKL